MIHHGPGVIGIQSNSYARDEGGQEEPTLGNGSEEGGRGRGREDEEAPGDQVRAQSRNDAHRGKESKISCHRA